MGLEREKWVQELKERGSRKEERKKEEEEKKRELLWVFEWGEGTGQ